VADDLDDILARASAHPDDVAARIAAAYGCDRVGREEEAVRHYDAAWGLGVPDPQRRRFLVGYGSTLRNVGRIEESLALLGEAVAADPGYAPLKVFLALALASAGEPAAALATALDALLEVAAGAPLDGYERAIASYQAELLARAVAPPAAPGGPRQPH
jgi:tetratricopeptide (TPR) repeat protein